MEHKTWSAWFGVQNFPPKASGSVIHVKKLNLVGGGHLMNLALFILQLKIGNQPQARAQPPPSTDLTSHHACQNLYGCLII